MNKIVILFLLFPLTACKPAPKVLWRFQTGAPVYASPSIAGNLLVIGSNDHFLYGIDLKTGKQVWKQDLGERIGSKPWVDDGQIYVGSGNGELVRLDATTGKVAWKFKTGKFIHYDPCGDEDSIYFGSNDGHFYKVRKDGTQAWSYDTGRSYNWGSCVFYKNLVIATTWNKYCYALDRLNGSLVWKVSSGERNYWGPSLSGNEIVFGTHDFLARVNPQNGKILARTTTTYLIHAFVYQGFLWSFEETQTVKRKLDGTPVATLKLPNFAPGAPVIVSNYFIVTTGSVLVALSPDLKTLWKFKGEETFWAPGVEREGIFYVGSRDGSVYALKLPRG